MDEKNEVTKHGDDAKENEYEDGGATSDEEYSTTEDKDPNSFKRTRFQNEMQTLNRELEIVLPHVNKNTNRRRRKVPRAQRPYYTKKRKELEVEDHEYSAPKSVVRKRLRGAKKALDLGMDAVSTLIPFKDDKKYSSDIDDAESGDDREGYQTDNTNYTDMSEVEFTEDEDNGLMTDDERKEESDEDNQNQETNTPKRLRKLHKLKNFKSERLVKYHGEALSAFAQGHNDKAIQTLQKVASKVPDAPQIYSSLGMVYETLLGEKKLQLNEKEDVNERRNKIMEIINIGKKGYGANHIAAFLFRKDYHLWVRAADIAYEISLHHDEMLRLSPPTSAISEKHRFEKYHWIEEALKDYKMADNLDPPGINIPIRLANVYFQLGSFSEALSILTDLRTSSAHEKELNRSYGAWLFYADVMLRLGHECKIYNEFGKTNYSEKNYTLKRWLKLYSKVFDWKERRLQALCLAMEAGTGTANCRNLMSWITERSVILAREKSKKQPEVENDPNSKTNGILRFSVSLETLIIQQINPTEETGNLAENGSHDNSKDHSSYDDAKKLEEQRRELLHSNKKELEAFDLKSSELGMEDSSKRKEERDKLIQKHRNAVVDLVGTYHSQQKTKPTYNSFSNAIPMTASISAVSQIASQLLNLCLDMNLYQGGIFAAEAMSSYLKERVQRKKRMKAKLEFFHQKQKRNIAKDMFPYEAQVHDEIRDETDESDEDDECQIILSDDEEFDALNDSTSVQQLPPNIRFLQTLCFLGKGGADYVAIKAVHYIISTLSPEIELNLDEEMIDTEMYPDPSWQIFRHQSNSMFSMTEAFTYLALFLRSHEEPREIQLSNEFLHLYKDHLTLLERNDALSRAGIKKLSSTSTITSTYFTNLYQEFLIALARMHLIVCKKKTNEADEEVDISAPDEIANANFVINLIERYRDILWQSAFEILKPVPLKMLQYTSEASAILMNNLEKHNFEYSNELRAKLFYIISGIFEVNLFSDRTSSLERASTENNWTSFPLPSNWQSASHQLISKQTYNLCIGCSVSTFSGWEMDEFTINRLQKDRRKIRKLGIDGQVYFGVHVRSPQVCGLLDPQFEKELMDQWSDIVKQLPDLSQFDFEQRLSSTKESDWYNTLLERYETEQGNKKVSTHGERFAITLLLQFSKLCLSEIAHNSLIPSEKEGYFRIVFSILLPLTRFCLNEKVWDSPIGTAASKKSLEEEYKYIKWVSNVNDENSNVNTETQLKKTKRYKNLTTVEENPVAKKGRKFVPVAASISLNEWLTCEFLEDDMPDLYHKEEACDAMEKLNVSMKQLRDCVSLQACHKSFITVAVALLDLVSLGVCHNPFVCLHQAAIFASHGVQGGNSDLPFRRLLPSIEDISALESLVILGRADCMRALSFIDQAMFLCTFILRICSLRRSCTNPDFMWNVKWRIVGIHAYLVSAAIDEYIKSLPGCDVRNANTRWDKDVVQELKFCRKDAIALNKSYAVKANFAVLYTEEDESESSDSDDEDEMDGADADKAEDDEAAESNMVTTTTYNFDDYFSKSKVDPSNSKDSQEVFAL